MKKRFLNLCAVLLSVIIWFMIHQQKFTTISCSVPLCFYNAETSTITAPEAFTITLYAQREDLVSLDLKNLAAHINAQTLKPGTNYIFLHEHNLCLPSTISIKNYTPAPLRVTYTLNK